MFTKMFRRALLPAACAVVVAASPAAAAHDPAQLPVENPNPVSLLRDVFEQYSASQVVSPAEELAAIEAATERNTAAAAFVPAPRPVSPPNETADPSSGRTSAAKSGKDADDKNNNRAARNNNSGRSNNSSKSGKGASEGAEEKLTAVFAHAPGFDLHLPHPNTVVGFHEASSSVSLPMAPHGTVRANDNPGRIAALQPHDEGPQFDVMVSRGRGTNGTTAADLSMADNKPVRAPVTGTVTEVRPYSLYGTYPDNVIKIVPAGNPNVDVVVLHVEDPHVKVGDRVSGGLDVVAGSANKFPFESQVDLYVGRPDPHVHVEVRNVG